MTSTARKVAHVTSGLNLTRDETAERARLITVNSIAVELDLSGDVDDPTYASTSRLSFESHETGATTWVDVVAERINRAVLNGRELDVTTAFDGTRLVIDNLEPYNELLIEADARYMNTGEGLHRFVDPVDSETYLYTQFEPADARRVYACFEQPDLKIHFQLTVTAPAHWTVVSNAATPEPEEVAHGVARWTFPSTERLSTYVTALIAGPYHSVTDQYVGEYGTYPLGVHCRSSLAEHLDPDDILTITKQGFEYFEGVFGVGYPFGKYDQLFVPEFNAGAMENAGAVTILEDYVFRSRVTDAAYEQRANTILHELAHMWFGDLVTMTWWDDLWLNESFAEWASHQANVEATRYREAWTTFLNLRKAWAYRQDQLPTTHPIAADMVDLDAVAVNFDGITYAKGAAALRQLVAWVGEAEFFAGVRAYFVEHAWGNTSLPDLLGHLERASGRDLSTWTRQWLQTSGVNLLRPELEVDASGCITSLVIVQEPASEPPGLEPVLRSHRVAIGGYTLTNKGLVRTSRTEIDVVGARTEVAELAGVAQPDLLLINDDDLTFAKTRLDERSLRTAVEHIGDLTNSLPRALIWGAAWDMTRDAEMSTGDFLTLALSGLPSESDVGVVQQVIRQVKAAIDMYAQPDHRAGYLTRLADALLALAEAAEPGSDHQLAFVRGWLGAATSSEHLSKLTSLLDGTEVLKGLTVDADMRWTMLQRLIATGAVGPEAIDDEAQRDHTATGQRQAAYARAAVPTAEAKEAAWSAIMTPDALPNALLEATVGGFVQPDQRELQAAFTDRYFEALPVVWATRTNEIAQTVVQGLYPALIVDTDTVERTDAFLSANGDLAFGARRLVTEGADGVRRALRARAADLGS